jgi:hypothetical protein
MTNRTGSSLALLLLLLARDCCDCGSDSAVVELPMRTDSVFSDGAGAIEESVLVADWVSGSVVEFFVDS